VNDGILKTPFSFQYVTVDAVIDGIMVQGHCMLLAKWQAPTASQHSYSSFE